MGGCCAENRNMPKPIDEKGSKSRCNRMKLGYDNESPQKRLTLTDIRNIADESDSEFDPVIDFYWCSLKDFFGSWKNALIESQKSITPPNSGEDCDKPFPYLISPFYDSGSNIMICSKPFPEIYRAQLEPVDAKGFLDRYLMRKFVFNSMSEESFRNELCFLLKYFHI